MAHGSGKFISDKGSTCKGNWSNDLQHGSGEEFFPDGSCYKGNFFEGQKVGQGVFTWKDGSWYEGNFEKNSVIGGVGIYKFKDGNYYKGEWKKGKMHGQGIFIWKDGKQFIGEYKFDKKEGYGRYIWAKDQYFEGYWKDGKQHGFGVLLTGGQTNYCHWRFGRVIRELTPEHIESFKNNEFVISDFIKKIVMKFKDYEPTEDRKIITARDLNVISCEIEKIDKNTIKGILKTSKTTPRGSNINETNYTQNQLSTAI